MTKKEYLKCYREAREELDKISKELITLDCCIDSTAIDYAAPRVQSSSSGDGAIINAVNRSVNAHKRRLIRHEKLTDLIHDIDNSIDTLEDDIERTLLNYRFRDNLTLSATADIMNYSERHLRRISKNALLHLVMPDKYIKLTKSDVGFRY